LIPTAGRIELECALASIAPQLAPDDEVLIIGDTLNDGLRGSQAITRSFGPQFRWLEYKGTEHSYGHQQLNYGISQATGAYLHCNDDDDIWTPDAAASMRRGIDADPGRPLLFRFQSWHFYTYWDWHGMLAQDHVGGHCLLAPNIPGKVGKWGDHYQGDFDYVMDTVTLHGGIDSVVWRDEIVVIARPNIELRRQVLAASGRTVTA
jgi:hypothetical protein